MAVASQARRHEQEDVVVVVRDEDHGGSLMRLIIAVRRGELDPEHGSAAVARAGGDRAAVRLGDRLRDEQAEAGARHLPPSTARSVRKNRSKTRGASSSVKPTPVSHTSSTAVAVLRRRDLDASALGRELDRVRDEVVEQLEHAARGRRRPAPAPFASKTSSRPFASARRRASSAAWRARSRRSSTVGVRSSRPAWSRATKSRSSTRRSSRCELRATTSR